MPTIKQLYDYFNLIPVGDDKAPNFSIAKQVNEKYGLGNDNKETTIFWEQKVDSLYFKSTKIGICCGVDNLEVIDIDNHFGDAEELFKFLSDNYNLTGFPVIKTGGGGYHVYYKCSEGVETGKKLAMRLNPKLATEKQPEGKWEALFETKGSRGYVVFYNNIIQGDILNVPNITAEERQTILDVCRAMDERQIETETEKPAQPKQTATNKSETETPGDLYNSDPGDDPVKATAFRQHSGAGELISFMFSVPTPTRLNLCNLIQCLAFLQRFSIAATLKKRQKNLPKNTI